MSWKCTFCTFINVNAEAPVCEMCEKPKPSPSMSWRCTFCKRINKRSKNLNCETCGRMARCTISFSRFPGLTDESFFNSIEYEKKMHNEDEIRKTRNAINRRNETLSLIAFGIRGKNFEKNFPDVLIDIILDYL